MQPVAGRRAPSGYDGRVCLTTAYIVGISADQRSVTLALQAFNDSARSSGGARPGGGPFGAESKHTSGPFSSTGQLIKAPGSSAAAVGLPDVAGESCRDVGSIEGWQALTAQIMGEVSHRESQATSVEGASKAEVWAASPSLRTSP